MNPIQHRQFVLTNLIFMCIKHTLFVPKTCKKLVHILKPRCKNLSKLGDTIKTNI